MGELQTKDPGFWARMWAKVTGKALPTTSLDDPDDFIAPSAIDGTVVSPAYDPETALSAYAAFPWVRACITAKVEDLAALPRYVMVGEGDDAERFDDHPVLDLLKRPNPNENGVIFTRQRLVDLFLSGNAMRAVAGVALGEPVSLHRLHPDLWRPELDAHGGIASWQGESASNSFPATEVLHDRYPSWVNDGRMVLGESPIRSLDRDLTTDMNAAKLAARLSATGQPRMMLTPDPKDPRSASSMDREAKRKERAGWERALQESKSGTVIGNRGWIATPFGLTPRDMEFEKTRIWGRDSTLAALGVPPSRVGIPTANYATSREQMKVYWRTLMGEAAVLDATDAELARMYTRWARANLGGAWKRKLETMRVVTDFSAVEALQESRTERLQRVQTHIFNGVPPAMAYREEGFEELASEMVSQPAPAPEAEPAEVEEEEEKRLAANGGKALTLFRAAPELVPPPEPSAEEVEAQRTAQWEAYIERTHKPLERLLQHAMQEALREQARVLASRVPELLSEVERGLYTKQLTEDEVASVLRIAESMGILRDAAMESIRKALERGLREALGALGIDVPLDARRLQRLLDARLGTMVQNVSPETRNRVRQVVVTGLDQGLTTNEIQAALMQDAAFNASRALRIARTETTTALEEGADEGYSAATDAGVKFDLQWLTARDGSVRDSHRPMDQQLRKPGQKFTSGAGHSTVAPGQFGIASEDVNCRCTRVPKIIEEQ